MTELASIHAVARHHWAPESGHIYLFTLSTNQLYVRMELYRISSGPTLWCYIYMNLQILYEYIKNILSVRATGLYALNMGWSYDQPDL